MTLDIGLMSLPSSWTEAQRHAELAQATGCSTLWTGDHLRHPRDVEEPFLDGWSLLPAWAATTTVRIGMLVTNIIYRHPAVVARQAAAIDVISRGRLTLGVGAGVYTTDHAMAGVPEWTAGERVARLDEFVEIVDALLRGDVVSHLGRYYVVRDAAVRPRPEQVPRPPVVVGALGSRTIAIAVRRADVWNTWAGFHADEQSAIDAVRRQSTLVDESCEAAARDPGSLRRSICLYPPFDPWRAVDELERLVDVLTPFGITEFIAYAPDVEREHVVERALARVLAS